MIQFKLSLCLAALLGLAVFANHMSAQDADPTISQPVAKPNVAEVPAKPRSNDDFQKAPFRESEHGLKLVPPSAVQSDAPGEFYGVTGLTIIAGKSNTRKRIVTRYVQDVVYDPIPADEVEESKQFESAIQKYKDSMDDQEKANLTTTIQQLLERQFQRDLKRREEELAPIEARVKSLRKQLDTRKESMNNIIDLRFKTIINSIDGLGFPDEDGRFGLPGANPGTPANNTYSIDTFGGEFHAPKKESAAKPRSRTSKKEVKPAKPIESEPTENE